jgi:hypothetical protein
MPPTNSAAFFSFSRFAAKAAEFRISLTQELHVGIGLSNFKVGLAIFFLVHDEQKILPQDKQCCRCETYSNGLQPGV